MAGLLVVCLVLLALDLRRRPGRQWTGRVLVDAVQLYRATLSPVLSHVGVHCRFRPTCSRYAEVVIREHGVLGGTGRSVWRLLRCGPWTPAGTVDPP